MRTPHRIAAAALALAGLAGPALAHGPTVAIGPEGVAPPLLRIARGETVHFANGDTRPHRVRGDGDAFRSPELAPGAGWHLPFPFPGRFPYVLEGAEPAGGGRGVIVVEDRAR